MSPVIPTRIVESVEPAPLSPRQVTGEFKALVHAGAVIHPAGEAKDDPARLLRGGYLPKYKLELFDTRFYLTRVRQNPAIRFFVVYVVQSRGPARKTTVFPRIFYKDVSLVWRTASHMVSSDEEFWIGKGAVETVVEHGHEITRSVESTTDLPLELQVALEVLNRDVQSVPTNEAALYLVLRNGPPGRVRPYRDFTEPRRIAAANPKNRIYGGRKIARFARRNDPTSLTFVRGFEPDLSEGVLEVSRSSSALYGGELRRYRILSRNRRIQYLFIAGPEHVWIIPPQATTTDLSSFGVRTIDVHADEDLFVPGYEYHYFDHDADPPCHFSQIPDGFAAEPNAHDPSRADASPWLEHLPVIREFRRRVLRQ